MRQFLLIGTILLLSRPLQSGQSSAIRHGSPKEVVEDFWGIETNGGRLTPEGWHKTTNFFIRARPADLSVIHVIPRADNGRIDETARTQNHAEVYVGTLELGELDSALRYKSAPERAANGAVIGATMIKYDLVLADRYWELKRDGSTGAELTGPAEWRIASIAGGNGPWITVDTAIRYVEEKRDKTSDPAIKKNADATLAALRRQKD
jgi:hypothetical protein